MGKKSKNMSQQPLYDFIRNDPDLQQIIFKTVLSINMFGIVVL